jgi:predicted AAA+ superfamily ATPase
MIGRMIRRTLQPHLAALAQRHPVVTLTGPRQSGKTTLCRATFPDAPYVSIEAPDEREFARSDPRAFLDRFRDGAVIDEVQRVPDLLSYIQQRVDERPPSTAVILTGSQHLGLVDAVTQTLAGRSALLQLLPLSLDEVRRFPAAPQDLSTLMWTGAYPRIYDRRLPPAEWLASYVATYVERDVRQVLEVGDLVTFQTFLRVAAGRVGQLLNLSALGADCGITHTTARRWVSVLEASYVAFRLPPLHANVRKRLVKAPKLYFYDTGLLCYLLGIRQPDQLETHPLRGPIFECWVISELLKHHLHRGETAHLSFYRDRRGHEVDLLLDRGSDLVAVEVKAGRTPASDAFAALEDFHRDRELARRRANRPVHSVVVYGGETTQTRSAGQLLSWREIDAFPWIASPGR